ncbi:MAG: hypothetical protein AMK70_00300 [Nitrospira bacterium SG8_35_1]|nr:MAG: hypothetical protein AMK70_00300 [Nitrospira bacterium SG8_35_1]
MKIFKDRRKHERLSVNNRSTVLIYPTLILSYGVIDISNSGFAFSYAGWENWPPEGLKIDLIDQNFFLENVPIRLIDDVRLNDESKKLRRCGAEFNNVEADQQFVLTRFIESLATN